MQVDFPTGALSSNGTNVILIIQDHMGLDQGAVSIWSTSASTAH